MKKKHQLIILGTGSFAQLAYHYFNEDSSYEVIAFTANSEYVTEDTFFNLPLVAFETIESTYPVDKYYMFVAIGYTKLNKQRTELYLEAKEKGYKIASYVYSKIKIWSNNKIGENTFIFEDNTIQPYVEIGNNVVLWSGNHIGHHSVIGNHCFLTSHVVISGHVTIENYCFFGVNATVRDSITIAEKTIVGAGALILKTTKSEDLFIGERTKPIANRKSTTIKKI